MNAREQIYEVLERFGLDVYYNKVMEGMVPDYPFLLYMFSERNDFYADNSHLRKITAFDVYLVARQKEDDMQAQLETLFEESNLAWESQGEYYVSEEKLYHALYRVEVLERG